MVQIMVGQMVSSCRTVRAVVAVVVADSLFQKQNIFGFVLLVFMPASFFYSCTCCEDIFDTLFIGEYLVGKIVSNSFLERRKRYFFMSYTK